MKKILTLTSLILLALTITGYYYISSQSSISEEIEEELIDNRSFFKEFDKEAFKNDQQKLQGPQIPKILSYKFEHTIILNQSPIDHGQSNKISDIKVQAQADVQSVYNSKTDIFEIAVSFAQLSKTNEGNGLRQGEMNSSSNSFKRRNLKEESQGTYKVHSEGNFEGEYPNGSTEGIERNDRFFIVYVKGNSGQIMGFKAESGYEEDSLSNWVTQQFVNDILPDLRKNSFRNRVKQPDNLGEINVKYEKKQHQDGHLRIIKSYDHNDYVKTFIPHLTHPEQNYRRELKMEKEGGTVHSGSSVFNFKHGQDKNIEGEIEERMGMIHGNIKHSFEKTKCTEDSDYMAQEMWRYRHHALFHHSPLYFSNKSKINYGNGNNDPFQMQDFMDTTEEEEEENNNQDGFDQYYLKQQQYEEKKGFIPPVQKNNKMENVECEIGWECREEKEKYFNQGKSDEEIKVREEHGQQEQVKSYALQASYEHYENYPMGRNPHHHHGPFGRYHSGGSIGYDTGNNTNTNTNNNNNGGDSSSTGNNKSYSEVNETIDPNDPDVVYKHTDRLAHLKVFGSQIHVDYDYVVKSEKSSMDVRLMVNEHEIMNFIKVGWENCKNHPHDMEKSKEITLFKATFPLLGIIVIPVEASVKLNWGYKAGIHGGPRFCEVYFNPYFLGSLYADGQASILHIISAGIYAEGTFLDANLDLKIGTNSGKSYTSLKGHFQGYTLSIGATWTKFKCSLKRLTSRMLSEQQQQDDVDDVDGKRRGLWHVHIHKPHFKKIVQKIKHVVKRVGRKVVPIVKKVAKAAYNVVTKGPLKAFCDTSKGYKQILKKHTKDHDKTFFDKKINIGL